jgi:hypothetical protein
MTTNDSTVKRAVGADSTVTDGTVRSMGWLYVPGMTVSGWDLGLWSEAIARSVTWRSKHSPGRTWLRRWKRVCWLRLLSGPSLPPSTVDAGAARWISSLPGSRVSRSRSGGTARAPATRAGSGRRSRESFARYDRGSCCWKTCPGLFRTKVGSRRFSGTWPKAGSMRSGIASVRRNSGPRTSASAFSFWPTPLVYDARSPGPNCRYHGLAWMVEHRVWLKELSRRVDPNGRAGKRLSRMIAGPRPRLNPRFAEWLMGLPIGWTDSGCVEMESFQSWRQRHLSSLRDGQTCRLHPELSSRRTVKAQHGDLKRRQ